MADILPPAPLDAPFGAYGWNDWYRKVRDAINDAQEIPFSSITGLPTTVAGYGITNAVFLDSGRLRWSSPINNGAGAAVGTLTNAPSAGNPTKWLEVNDDGVIRRIPAW